MYTILVVDDEKEVVEYTCARLSKSGMRPLRAYNAAEGFEKAKEEKPDLILLDIIMPGGDGIGMLRDLRGYEPTSKIPVIMVTAKGHLNEIEGAQELGATDYFVKPFEWKELLKFIKRYLPD